MKRLIYIIAIIATFGSSLPALAVTEKEMEQARVIATQAYLRYANDGSGYLDDLHPKSMSELERSLKAKEKENIKAFKAIPVPKDYASWNKEKLVDYWCSTAFSTKGLVEKGRQGKNRARKRIGAMTVSAPAKAAEKKPEAEKAKTDAAPAAAAPAKPAQEAAPGEAAAPQPDSLMTKADEAEALATAALEEDEEPLSKAENHTWVYVVILCILVGVVVALVVFASNVMKRNQARMSARRESLPESDDVPNANALREKFAAKLNEKNNEVHALNKKIEELLAHNNSLKNNMESLTAETASLRTRLTEATGKIAQLEAALQNASAARQQAAQAPRAEAPAKPQTPVQAAPRQAEQQPKPQRPSQGTPLRTIYLGRANAKGIFVRADRSLNIGNSIFRLDTTDGYAGTFRVANDPTVWEMALLTPRESLSGACVAPEIDNTDGMEKIVNDSAGTAIFEGGCWKVIRKAKIHFE